MKDAFAVAIDGPVAAGKTTVGRMLAAETGALFFDTGIVYRAVAHQTLARGIAPHDGDAVAALAGSLDITLSNDDGETRLFVDGVDISDDLRTPEVDRALPPISANPQVRRALLACQRNAVEGQPAVVVGRDIGTVILPDADVKIYLDAAPDVRANRRYDELRARGIAIERDTVLRDLRARDARDTTRDHAPLERARGAIVVEATDRSVEDVVAEILDLVSLRRASCGAHAE